MASAACNQEGAIARLQVESENAQDFIKETRELTRAMALNISSLTHIADTLTKSMAGIHPRMDSVEDEIAELKRMKWLVSGLIAVLVALLISSFSGFSTVNLHFQTPPPAAAAGGHT